MYRLSAYYAARTASDLPIELIYPTLFVIVIYWFGGLRASAGEDGGGRAGQGGRTSHPPGASLCNLLGNPAPDRPPLNHLTPLRLGPQGAALCNLLSMLLILNPCCGLHPNHIRYTL